MNLDEGSTGFEPELDHLREPVKAALGHWAVDRGVEAEAWNAIRLRAQRRRSWRMAPVVAAVTLLLVGSGIVIARNGAKPTQVAAGRPDSSIELSAVNPRSIPSEVIPSLRPLFSLPACSERAEFSAWMADALAAYTTVSPAAIEPTALAEVARSTPIPRDAQAACSLAGQSDGAQGWELRNAAGTVLGRGASVVSTSGRSVPRRLVEESTTYHQEWIASGQSFSGVVDGARVEGLTRSVEDEPRIFVADVPALVTSGADAHAAGMRVLARLTLARVTAFWNPEDPFNQPTRLPAGFARCSSPQLGVLLATGDRGLTEYCNDSGTVLSLSNRSSPPASGGSPGSTAEVNGLRAEVKPEAGNRLRLTLTLPSVGRDPNPGMVSLVGPESLGSEALAAVLGSVPALSPGALRPRTGDRDLRDRYGEEWIFGVLERAGAGDVVRTRTRTVPCSPLPSATSTPAPTIRTCPAPDGYLDFSFTTPDGVVATLNVQSITGDGPMLTAQSMNATDVLAVEPVDILVRQVFSPSRGLEQAVIQCGHLLFSLVTGPTPSGNSRSEAPAPIPPRGSLVDFTRRLVPEIGC